MALVYSLLTLPASVLMLLRPMVAPKPCSVPREPRELMALELAVVPAAGGEREEEKKKREREAIEAGAKPKPRAPA